MFHRSFPQPGTGESPGRPFLASLPIALWSATAVSDILSRVAVPSAFFANISWYMLLLGTLAAAAAAPTGIASPSDLGRQRPVRRLAFAHMLLCLMAMGVASVNVVLRAAPETALDGVGAVPLALSQATALSAILATVLGNRLVRRRLPSRGSVTIKTGHYVPPLQPRDLSWSFGKRGRPMI